MSDEGWDPVERATALLDATAPWFPFSIDPKAVTTEELALAGVARGRRLLAGMVKLHDDPDLAGLLSRTLYETWLSSRTALTPRALSWIDRSDHLVEGIGHAGLRRPRTPRWARPQIVPAGSSSGSMLAGRAAHMQDDYNVVMTHPMSVRFREARIMERLKTEAEAHDRSASALAEELIDEGLRQRRHPLIVFRDGASGRRAALVGGPDVWEVIAGTVGGDVPARKRVERAIEVVSLRREQVDAALGYYAEFTDEVDGEIAANAAAAEEVEALWRRQQDLLAR